MKSRLLQANHLHPNQLFLLKIQKSHKLSAISFILPQLIMNRRDFLTTAATTAASSMILPVLLDGFGVKALGRDSALVRALRQTTATYQDRVLVIIYLNGGNDGLNTVIPRDQYSAYMGLRSNIAIPENKVLPLSGNDATGFHPNMAGMQALYNEGKLVHHPFGILPKPQPIALPLDRYPDDCRGCRPNRQPRLGGSLPGRPFSGVPSAVS